MIAVAGNARLLPSPVGIACSGSETCPDRRPPAAWKLAARASRTLAALALLLAFPPPASATEALVPLVQPGPWSAVSGLIGYGGRLWFVNSVKFVNHNSADVYSYDPIDGAVCYQRHLFSQDAGDPVVADGLLYWPFEDARFSTGRGEYMVTNGRDWQWRALPDGRVFHVHAMAAHGGTLYAATSAWRAGLQRSDDGGASWRVVYDHPTKPGLVSRITTLEVFEGKLYAGLTNWRESGARLLRWSGETLRPLAGWPEGHAVTALAAFGGWLYAVNVGQDGRDVWRTDGASFEPVNGLKNVHVRDLAAGAGALWAVSAGGGGGALWRSADGVAWTVEQRFEGAEPLDVATYAGRVYVGTIGPDGRGALWGPPPPAPAGPPPDRRALPPRPAGPSADQAQAALSEVERLLANGPNSAGRATATPLGTAEAEHKPDSFRASIRETLRPLALAGDPEVGRALATLLEGPFPARDVALFGGKTRLPAARVARWYLLWAMARNGGGRMPPELLAEPWTQPPNGPEKYLHPVTAAAWTAAQLGQADTETLGALIGRLGGAGDPDWLDGDLVGALTALTGARFGHDRDAWRAWWARRGMSESQAVPGTSPAPRAGATRTPGCGG